MVRIASHLRPSLPPAAVTRRFAIVATLPALFSASPRRADAAFGPAGGSVLSKPPLQKLNADQYLSLSPEKLAQRAGALSQQRLDDVIQQIDASFNSQERDALDALVDKLEEERAQNPSKEVDAELAQLQEKLRTASRALTVAQQLRDRQRLEARLQAQPAWVAYGCAAVASVGSTLVAHPVDTFKTLQQAQAGGGARSRSGGGELAAVPAVAALPPLPELYRGLLPNIFKEAPSSALYLGIYELVRGRLNGPDGPLAAYPLLGYLVSGAVGELVGSVVRAPSEAAKSRVQSGVAANVGEAVSQVVLDPRGRRNTLRAWASSLLRDVPMGAIQIAIFEVLKAYVIQSPDVDFDTNTLSAEALFGATGGLIGALVTTPADVVTTRIMTREEGGGGSNGGDDAPPGPVATAREIFEADGVFGFANGALARAGYWAPAIGIFLSLYCSLRQLALQYL